MFGVMLAGWSLSSVLAVMAGSVGYVGLLVILRPLNAEERAMLAPIIPRRFKRIAAA